MLRTRKISPSMQIRYALFLYLYTKSKEKRERLWERLKTGPRAKRGNTAI